MDGALVVKYLIVHVNVSYLPVIHVKANMNVFVFKKNVNDVAWIPVFVTYL